MIPAKPNTKPGRHSGVTLIETLVVLIIVSMVASLLFQGLSHSLAVQRRIGGELALAEQGAMLGDWFRGSIQGLQPDYADGRDKFAGDGRRLGGLTLLSPTGSYGAPVSAAWELAYDSNKNLTRLDWGRDANKTTVMSWDGGAGRFRYLDAKGESHDAWPPPLGQFPQLPRAVVLDFEWQGQKESLVANVYGPARPRVRARDVFGTELAGQ